MSVEKRGMQREADQSDSWCISFRELMKRGSVVKLCCVECLYQRKLKKINSVLKNKFRCLGTNGWIKGFKRKNTNHTPFACKRKRRRRK